MRKDALRTELFESFAHVNQTYKLVLHRNLMMINYAQFFKILFNEQIIVTL